MSRNVIKQNSTLLRIVALFMLSVMVTLLIGRSVHTYIHSTHTCEHSSNGGDDHDHKDCKICKFEFSFFDRVDELILACITLIITVVSVGYIQNIHILDTSTRSSRAPLQSII